MNQISNLDGSMYKDEDVVYFRNILQSIFYLEHSAELVDLFVDGNHKLVFVFSRLSHEMIISKWMAQKEKDEGGKDG